MVGLGSIGGSGKAGNIAIIATPLPSKVTLRSAVRSRIVGMSDLDGEVVALAKGGDMNEEGETEQENTSDSGSDETIRRTFADSVVAVVFIGMLFTALLAWTDTIDGTGDFRICEYDVHGLGFWIYENDKELCWFSVTDMIGVGIFATISISPLTFPLCFLAILISRRKRDSHSQGTDSKS